MPASSSSSHRTCRDLPIPGMQRIVTNRRDRLASSRPRRLPSVGRVDFGGHHGNDRPLDRRSRCRNARPARERNRDRSDRIARVETAPHGAILRRFTSKRERHKLRREERPATASPVARPILGATSNATLRAQSVAQCLRPRRRRRAARTARSAASFEHDQQAGPSTTG